MEQDYIQINKDLWEKRTQAHIDSSFYDMTSFLEGKSSLNQVELDQMGDVSGKTILHLQCHFGQDSLSFARMGAKVTGVDFSEKAIAKAQDLNKILNLDAEFICCDVLKLDEHLKGSFDLVFASYGTIGWLEKLNKWGELIAKYLKPGGELHFVEFHPALWMFDDDFTEPAFSYFNTEPIIEETKGSYAAPDGDFSNQAVFFNHSFDEIFSSLIDQGLVIKKFKEYDYSPYDCFFNTVKTENGYQISGLEGKLPMLYSLHVQKPI